MGWDNPLFIIGMFLGAMAIAVAIMRAANRRRGPSFTCAVCGRKQHKPAAREWRYCPYCGSPRDARSTRTLPRRGISALDID